MYTHTHIYIYTDIYTEADLVLLFFIDTALFYKLKVCGNQALSKSIDTTFPKAFAHFMSMSHFGNSRNVSNFFFIILLVVVIFDTTTITPWRFR